MKYVVITGMCGTIAEVQACLVEERRYQGWGTAGITNPAHTITATLLAYMGGQVSYYNDLDHYIEAAIVGGEEYGD